MFVHAFGLNVLTNIWFTVCTTSEDAYEKCEWHQVSFSRIEPYRLSYGSLLK